MPSIPFTNPCHSSTIASALGRRATADTTPQPPPQTPVAASTVIAIIFLFAAITIITTSACIIFCHHRHHRPPGVSETSPGWRRVLANADRQSDSTESHAKEAQRNLGSKQVPMLQPMAFLQGREGPKEFVGGGGKRRSSAFPRIIADGMGGIWPRRHSVYTLNSSYAAGEDGEELGGNLSRRVSKKSYRSVRSSKATMTRKNGSALSTSSAKRTTTVQMERMIAKKPSITFAEPSPALSASPNAFPAPRLSRNALAPTSDVPSSYKKSRLRTHHQGDSFLEHDVPDDELQTNYGGSVGSAASSSMLYAVDLTAFPVPPLPALNVRNHANNR